MGSQGSTWIELSPRIPETEVMDSARRASTIVASLPAAAGVATATDAVATADGGDASVGCGNGRERQHQRQSDRRDDVADVSGAFSQGGQRDRRQSADERSLPDEMKQRPAHHLRSRLTQQVLNRAHLVPPSPSRLLSISFRISPSSSGVARRLDSACMTSFDADPPNARSTRSRTSWRWVCSSVSLD